MNKVLEAENDRLARRQLADALAGLAGRMSPTKAAEICSQAAHFLAEAMARTTDASKLSSLAMALTRITGCVSPPEAAKVRGRSAKMLISVLEKQTDDDARLSLASGLACTALRLGPDEAANAARLAAHTAAAATKLDELADLWSWFDKQVSEDPWNMLSPLSPRPMLAEAAQLIVAALDNAQEPDIRWCLAAGLVVVVDQMEPAAAAKICGLLCHNVCSSLRPEGGSPRYGRSELLECSQSRVEPRSSSRDSCRKDHG